jgi:hypothetical protein
MQQYEEPIKQAAAPTGYGYQGANQQSYGQQPTYGPPTAYPQPVAPGRVGCSLTRTELDEYLRQSGYGQNEAMFNCYFTRAPNVAAPLCIACQQPIGEHVQAVTGGNVGGNNMGMFQDFPTVAAAAGSGVPANMILGPHVDVAVVPLNKGLLMAATICAFIGVIQLVVFNTVGMMKVALIGPGLLLVIAVVLFCMLHRITITVNKGQGPNSAVTVVTRYAIFPCVPTSRTYTASSLRNITAEATSTRINRQRVYQVVARPSASDTITLYRGYVFDASAEAGKWCGYFDSVCRNGDTRAAVTAGTNLLVVASGYGAF